MKKIIIAGGSGFLGQVLAGYFTRVGYTIKILSRSPKGAQEVYWDAQTLGPWATELEGATALINLAGKSVDCRYTEENKKEIYSSRIESTHLLGLAINLCEKPPTVWFNSSTATIYRHSLDKQMTEAQGEIGDDFSMNIAKSWEQAFFDVKNPKTRKVALRSSIVMGGKGGALIPLKRLTTLGLGGKQGSGQQKVSWIHEIDFARAIDFILNSPDMEGPINLSVPQPTNNIILMRSLRKVSNMPFGLSHPENLIKFGAKLIGTEAELVLKSRNVIPKRLLDQGFKFLYEDIEIALTDLLKK